MKQEKGIDIFMWTAIGNIAIILVLTLQPLIDKPRHTIDSNQDWQKYSGTENISKALIETTVGTGGYVCANETHIPDDPNHPELVGYGYCIKRSTQQINAIRIP